MNERIFKLAGQAISEVPVPVEFKSEHFAFAEKFAESIVTECLDVVAMRIYLGNSEMCRQECKALAADIKEHFGAK